MNTMPRHPGPGDNGKPRANGALFSPEELDELEAMLLNGRAFLIGNVQKLEDEARNGAEDHSSVPLHLADVATDAFQLDMSLSFIENESGRVKEIDEALERLHDGSFGRCEECDQPLALERLRAVPYARFCVKCQTEREEEEERKR